MSYNPVKLQELGAYWVAHGGINLGVVGNAAHTVGYHLGRDRIYDGTGPGIGDNDYSVKLARDKAGLTNAASAIDLGRLNGSLEELRAFSRWLVARCMASAAVRHDFREIIYSPDGSTVQRYSAIDNKIHAGPGNGDDSHTTHTHISYLRDSQSRDKVAAFAPYFEKDDMGLKVKLQATTDTTPWDSFGTAKLNSGALQRVSDGVSVALATGTSLGTVQLGTLAGTTAIVALNHNGELHVVPKANVTFTTMTPPTPPEDCIQEVNAAVAPLNAQIAQLEQDVAVAHLAGEQAEWDRQNAGATVQVKLLDRP